MEVSESALPMQRRPHGTVLTLLTSLGGEVGSRRESACDASGGAVEWKITGLGEGFADDDESRSPRSAAPMHAVWKEGRSVSVEAIEDSNRAWRAAAMFVRMVRVCDGCGQDG